MKNNKFDLTKISSPTSKNFKELPKMLGNERGDKLKVMINEDIFEVIFLEENEKNALVMDSEVMKRLKIKESNIDWDDYIKSLTLEKVLKEGVDALAEEVVVVWYKTENKIVTCFENKVQII